MDYRVELHQNEIKMATSLVESLSAPFQPDKYTNRYREVLLEMIQARITGAEVEVPEPERPDKVVDLMAALKASIDLAKEERGRGEKKTRATTRGTARKKAVGESPPAKSM
jgi:DNA end-binding protein Ku